VCTLRKKGRLSSKQQEKNTKLFKGFQTLDEEKKA
jgi:hypothetical protein